MYSDSKLQISGKLVLLFVAIILTCGQMSDHFFDLLHQDKMNADYDLCMEASRSSTCAMLCMGQTLCKTFAFEQLNGRCYLYKKVLFAAEPSTGQIGITTYTTTFPRDYNIARSKPTKTSSVHGVERFPSKNGVDGNLTSFFHTRNDNLAWWCVDLGQIIYMKSIHIYNRAGEYVYTKRLHGFDIRFSLNEPCGETGANSAEICYKDDDSVQSIYNITCCNQVSTVELTARYVYVTVTNNYLHFGEIIFNV